VNPVKLRTVKPNNIFLKDHNSEELRARRIKTTAKGRYLKQGVSSAKIF
jgi:hypothetical protein